MESKPLKRNPHIQQLSKDHHFTLLFCWKIRQGLRADIDPERMAKYVTHFWETHMKVHFREEEEILFAPVHDDKVQKAIREHREIEAQIERTVQVAGKEAECALNTLADLVDRHVRYEERDLFPHLEKLLTSQQLEGIGCQLQKVHKAVADDFEDEFWLRKQTAQGG